MSEYQFYEFIAIDGPISDEGLVYAENCSTRADVSRFRWRNVYNYGGFHGNAQTLLKYYDAHFYIANWGTVRFALAFPEGCLNQDLVESYLRGNDRYEETLSVERIDGRSIVWWERNTEEGWGWIEGEGIIDRLIDIREELMRGDYRALFLGWLDDFLPDEWQDPRDSGVLVPPVPAGLDCLTPALEALIEQFPMDPDVRAVAAGNSNDDMPDRMPMATILDGLPVGEMKAFLQRVADGDGSRVMSELNRLSYPQVEAPSGEVMTCVDFATRVFEIRETRRQKEEQAAAAERKRAAAARKRQLKSILKKADTIWAELDVLMDKKIAAAYDDAAAQLQELHAAYEQARQEKEFRHRLAAFRERYRRRSAMMRRIEGL